MTNSLPRRTLLQSTAALAALPTAASAATGPVIKLRLLETSDLHSFDENYDYFRDTPDNTVGLTKAATLIRAARAQAQNTLLFDNGDTIQGNPLADYMALPGNMPPGHIHPTIRAMNTLNYDAATIGNHEFNYGLPFLTAALSGANFPFCTANIHNADGSPWLPPTLILNRTFTAQDGTTHALKIGVIGFTPPQITNWDKAHLTGHITTSDIVDAAQKHIPTLRPQVDLLIALSHSGISTAPRRGFDENASYYLAQIPGIDAIFTGHSHRVFPGPDYAGYEGLDATRGTLNNIPATMPGFWGSDIGIIDLTLTQQNGKWLVADFTCSTQPISQRDDHTVTSLATNDPQVDSAVTPDHQQTLAWIREPIGHLTQPLNSYFALIGTDASLALVNAAQTWYATPLLPPTTLPILSAAAPFKEGYQSPDNYVDLSAGTIAIKNVADLYMYPNTVCALQVTGAQLQNWLEHSAEIFNQIDPQNPAPQPLLNRHVPSYIFDVISGITYQIDITQPARFGAHGKFNANANRITNLRYQGTPITPDQQFIVITNNYRADSGNIVQNPNAVLLRAPDQTRDIIVRYILAQKTITVATPPVWSFAPIGAPVTVTFESSPAAARYLLQNPQITSQGDAGDGYTQFSLSLS
jgi:2',3'-cyclic-nucleotide 2'-phosphodiesterase/3'-nucleotidase